MNRLEQVLRNGSKRLIIGVALAVLPWLGSIYFCSRAPDSGQAADTSLPTKVVIAKASPPKLLPSGESVRCLLTSVSESQPDGAADSPTQQVADSPAQETTANHSANGPASADQAQAEKTQSAYIPSSGIVSEENLDESSSDSSPPVWMPVEMPIDEKTAEASPGETTLPAESASNGNLAVNPPKQEVDLSSQAATEAESSPEPNRIETLEKSDNSLESTPAAQSATVDNESQAPATDQEISYPSTEPFLAEIAATKDAPVRSEQLESIARQADQQTRHGFELAGRGAYFAARSEFIAALRLVAQGLDTEEQTKIHGKSLAAGLTAMKEAEDFIPGGSRLEADLDLTDIIAGHGTPVLKDADKDSLTTLAALKSYFTFAQEQLARAAGNEVAGSMAMHALGKLHEELAKGKGPGAKAAGPKAMVFYQASLLVCPQNFMASNDLGVMLARNGNYEDACKMLEHSLSFCKQSTVWHNLAMVYGRLGRADTAQRAQQQALIALQMEQARRQKMQVSAGNQVRWVDENTFTRANNPPGAPQNVPGNAVDSGKPMMQVTGPTAAPARGIMQPSAGRNWSANANLGQSPSSVGRPLPTLSPTTTGWVPQTPYDARR